MSVVEVFTYSSVPQIKQKHVMITCYNEPLEQKLTEIRGERTINPLRLVTWLSLKGFGFWPKLSAVRPLMLLRQQKILTFGQEPDKSVRTIWHL